MGDTFHAVDSRTTVSTFMSSFLWFSHTTLKFNNQKMKRLQTTDDGGANYDYLKLISNFLIWLGDEIIAINGRKVEGLSHAEVVLMFREVRRGAINIQLGRKLPKDQNGLYVTAQQLSSMTHYSQQRPEN